MPHENEQVILFTHEQCDTSHVSSLYNGTCNKSLWCESCLRYSSTDIIIIVTSPLTVILIWNTCLHCHVFYKHFYQQIIISWSKMFARYSKKRVTACKRKFCLLPYRKCLMSCNKTWQQYCCFYLIKCGRPSQDGEGPRQARQVAAHCRPKSPTLL